MRILGNIFTKNKKIIIIIASFVLIITAVCSGASYCLAAGGKISLTTEKTVLKKGEVFTVVCRVSSATGVLATDFYVDYNTSTLKFMSGGAKAVKEVGGVHINTADSTDSPVRRTYSLQFFAKEEGEASIFIRDGADVVDGEGEPLSLQTDRIELSITEDGLVDTPVETEKPVVTPEAVLSGNNKIKELTTNAIALIPDFSPDIKEYEATVDVDTDTFFIDYTLKNKNASAEIEGNKGLTYGENEVKLIVTAQNGKKRTYTFIVTRLSVETDDEEEYEAVTVSESAINPQIPLDKEDKNGYSIILYIVIALLAIFSISMVILVRRQRRELDMYEDMEERYEAEDDIGSGEGDYEGGEVRGEDGKSRYWY